MRHVERLADAQITTGALRDDVYILLAAGHAWLELPAHAEKVPLLLTASACGRLELVDVMIEGTRMRAGYEFVCGITRSSDQGHIAARIRDHFQARWSA